MQLYCTGPMLPCDLPTMIEQLIFVTPFSDIMYRRLESGATVILLFNGDDEKKMINAVAALRQKGISVKRIVLICKTLGNFIANGIAHSNHTLDIRLEKNPDVREILNNSDLMARSNRRFVLKLHTRDDATIIRVLCSLQIPVLIDIRDEFVNWEILKDLTTDALLGSAPRASMDPITALASSFRQESFRLADVYYENPVRYLWSDGTENLFLSEADMHNKRPLIFHDTDRWSHSKTYIQGINREYDILEHKELCAFCDGFFLCKGYLSQFNKQLHCKMYMNDFLDNLELKLCKQENQAPCS